MTDVKNPTNDPKPVFIAWLNSVLVTKSSPMTAPRNGPIKMPATGITKGPIIKPIVLPHIPAFVPPNFFTPIIFETESAANNKITNNISIIQNNQPKSEKEKNKPYTIKPNNINTTEGIIGYSRPTNAIIKLAIINIQATISKRTSPF